MSVIQNGTPIHQYVREVLRQLSIRMHENTKWNWRKTRMWWPGPSYDVVRKELRAVWLVPILEGSYMGTVEVSVILTPDSRMMYATGSLPLHDIAKAWDDWYHERGTYSGR